MRRPAAQRRATTISDIPDLLRCAGEWRRPPTAADRVMTQGAPPHFSFFDARGAAVRLLLFNHHATGEST